MGTAELVIIGMMIGIMVSFALLAVGELRGWKK